MNCDLSHLSPLNLEAILFIANYLIHNVFLYYAAFKLISLMGILVDNSSESFSF